MFHTSSRICSGIMVDISASKEHSMHTTITFFSQICHRTFLFQIKTMCVAMNIAHYTTPPFLCDLHPCYL